MPRFLPTIILFVLIAAPAFGQTPAPAQSGSDKPPDQQAPAPPPPYEGPLLRLAELMGSLHYLRGLCGAPDASSWRERMAALIDSEGGDSERKSKLAGAFNRGYRTFQQTYRLCNASADLTIQAYVEEGRRIARDINARYAY
jgi:uncharacterized protein (TIGR02301 family)